MSTQIWLSGRCILENEWHEPVTSKKITYSICCQLKNELLRKIRILEKLYPPPWSSQLSHT